MKKLVKPSAVSGTVQAPASKSVAQRVIAIASLVDGVSELYGCGNSDDVRAAIRVCRQLGAVITELPGKLVIKGGVKIPTQPLNCGESGLGIRMFSSIAATLTEPVVLTGEGTLAKRPMGLVEQSLKAMGATCKTTDGHLPILVTGPIVGGECFIDGSISSQVLTGMLIASPFAQNELVIEVENLQSKPYIDLTIETMKAFGVEVENDHYFIFRVKSGSAYLPIKYTVEGDWSGAAFFLVAGAIAGNVRVENLNPKSKQADRAILEVLFHVGAKVSVFDNAIEVQKHELNAFHFDATNCPDLFPPLVALAAHCNGESRILGVSRLRVKESDRAVTLQQEFEKLGVEIKIEGELMRITGGEVKGGKVNSHGDHRIAMSCAIASLTGEGDVEIENAEVVDKSYPEFFEDLNALTTSKSVTKNG
jgi:3-phosphoshikimate 1-carboxyvinyltransferase